MRRSLLATFACEDSGAISTLYAIAILPLVVMAGVAFDYGRMMGLDTELQNAADQAALAAATQLDGSSSAITNSQIAAANAVNNQTRFANDGKGRAIPTSGLTFVYYEDYQNDAPVNVTTDPTQAHVVEVTVEDRSVRYALTPVMATFSGGVARGRAMATLESATCNVPPLMFCVPNNPTTGTADRSFPTDSDIGRGLTLHFKSNSASSPSTPNSTTTDTTTWAPGNFGFLDINYSSSAGNPNQTTGLNSDFRGCASDAPDSDPGFRTPEGNAMNSRFDIYPPPKAKCDASGNFCPAENTRKAQVLEVDDSSCARTGNLKNDDWQDPPAGLQVPSGVRADQGFPKDDCFGAAVLPCTVVGDGNWSADTWLSDVHGTSTAAILATTDKNGNSWDLNGDGKLSRYEVYEWELADKTNRLKPTYVGSTTDSNGKMHYYCSFPQPIQSPPGIAATYSQKDRRILTVAAVDCTNLSGKKPVDIVRWVDLFLVQPVNTTADDRPFFTEIKGPAQRGTGQSGFQYYGRKKAVLLR
ncbi:TadE/TadG family type IV pilus assembly protein [Tsuneonella mangrovi]|uniref:TadE/TadG family type IV pilus assembly protein n=1 Tax=Tsuneonella mangrovi TaxID=1982042 RepID=UPI000BA29C1A|nr:pilus assembly protein TadG-related protein [Tsuneonella mangrovi]